MQQIPILDLNNFRENKEQFIAELGASYREYGFVGIKNHSINTDLLKKSYQVIQDFFNLDEAIKLKYEHADIGGARGYTRFGVEKAKDSNLPDLKEFWHVGREINDSNRLEMYPNVWPSEIAEFKNTLYSLYTELDSLGKTVLQAIALYLKLPENYFDSRINIGNSLLRAIHYPPVNLNTKSVRSAQHEDINLITLLVGSEQAGLEVLSRNNVWIPITTIPGTIVCNIGDMLQRLTNNYLPSTTHRVVNPENSQTARFSMPFFLHFNSDVLIETLESCISNENPNKYTKPITAHEYLLERLVEIGLLKK